MGYALMFVGVSSILLSFLLFHQNKSQYNIRSDFGLLMMFAGLWAVCIGVFFASHGNLVAIYVNYVVALIMVYCLTAFSMRLDGRKSSLVIVPHAAGFFLSLALSFAFVYDSTWIVTSINFINATNVTVQVVNPGYFLYGLAFSAAYFIAVSYLLNAIFRNLKSERSKYIQILGSILVVGFTGLLTNLYLPIIGNYAFIWMAPVLVVLVVFASSVSIVRYRTFDIKLAAVRSLAYGLSIIVLAFVYYFFAYIVSMTFFQGQVTSTFSVSPLNIVLALALAFIFQPIKAFFDRITDNIFYRDRYDPGDFYARMSELLATTTDLRNLLQRAATEIGNTLKAEQAFFFVQYDDSRRITAGTMHHKDLPLKDVLQLNAHVKKHGDDIIVVSLLTSDDAIRRMLISHRIALLMPLTRQDGVIGYLALGEQKSSGYAKRDLKVLHTVSDELVIAIQNALSVQEVKLINAHLEQRIATATAELRTSNARLKRLDASKDEFLSMASHQLRTPLTSVKGYLSMMLDGDMGKLTPMQKQVLEEAFSSSERMVHLIHDFLNVSRLQTGKFMLELSDVRLDTLIEQEVQSLESVAASHSMKLEFVNTAGEVTLHLDDTKMRQVVMNYIDNAIYYSHPDTTITISLETTDKEVIMRVKDTGIGVPKSEQEHLFEKFYRATNARKQRPDGTGVGIYLAKRVVAALGGNIVFESKEGKGSTFGFRLPLKQDESLLEDKTKQLKDQPA